MKYVLIGSYRKGGIWTVECDDLGIVTSLLEELHDDTDEAAEILIECGDALVYDLEAIQWHESETAKTITAFLQRLEDNQP